MKRILLMLTLVLFSGIATAEDFNCIIYGDSKVTYKHTEDGIYVHEISVPEGNGGVFVRGWVNGYRDALISFWDKDKFIIFDVNKQTVYCNGERTAFRKRDEIQGDKG